VIRGILLTILLASRITVTDAASNGPPSNAADVPRVGILANIPPNNPETVAAWNAFEQTLKQHGYVLGETLKLDRRYIEGKTEQLPVLAADVVRLNPSVIVVTAGASAARVMMAAAPATPIVLVEVGDPVGSGLVASLAHPGGNVTGIAALQVDLLPKRLELLKALLPNASRVALLLPSKGAFGTTWLPAAVEERAAAAKALGFSLIPIEIDSPKHFADAADQIARANVDALVVSAHPITNAISSEIAQFGLSHSIPTVACCRLLTRAGVLVSYGPNLEDELRRAAIYVDRILKGARPADLPVEQPTKFELIINAKTASQIGVSVPRSLLARADEIIK